MYIKNQKEILLFIILLLLFLLLFMLGNEYDCQIWVKMTKVIKTLSAVLMKFLPDYWKLCMHYIEGRYDQVNILKI